MADTVWIEQPFDFSNWPQLTKREMEMAWYIRQGLSNDQVAAKLVVSTATAKTHVHNLLIKFNVPSRWIIRDVLDAADFNPWGDPPAE
jgi:DNA-binding CsgD family transcriptional regulator